MKSTIAMTLGLFLVASASYAGVTINGTTITFADASTQDTANPPSDHGGTGNSVSGTDSFVGGGLGNQVTDDWGTVGGGLSNLAGDNTGTASDGHEWATVGGGYFNSAKGFASTIGGGRINTASGHRSTVGGGNGNMASGSSSTVGGGNGNTASSTGATVSGGYGNTASGGFQSTVGGGNGNTASGYWSTVGGGDRNTASGYYSTVAGGTLNMAGGISSFAAGTSANDGGWSRVFVWDDGSGSDATASNTFNVHASGGIILNGPVSRSSDRNEKEAFSFVSAREVLDKVVEMPVTTWRFKSEGDSVRHIGPMAQDFMAAFGYGMSDRHIVGTDADGVALVAIQGLHAMLEDQAEINTALRWHNAQLKALLHSRDESFEARFARLENAILREGERAPAPSTN